MRPRAYPGMSIVVKGVPPNSPDATADHIYTGYVSQTHQSSDFYVAVSSLSSDDIVLFLRENGSFSYCSFNRCL